LISTASAAPDHLYLLANVASVLIESSGTNNVQMMLQENSRHNQSQRPPADETTRSTDRFRPGSSATARNISWVRPVLCAARSRRGSVLSLID
jgi:hypothetical protein